MVLHNCRIKERFGDNRWFIRCDQFPASCTNFLNQLSKVIGTGIENPESLTSLRPFLSSRDIILILDNAESVLDPQGTDAHEIYAVVEELSQFNNICLCITSRISTIPPACETLDIPALSMEAACDTFCHIYKNSSGQSNLIEEILGQLDFHPLTVIILATVAHQNKWDTNRLAREWRAQQTALLHTHHNRSLAATIELSLSSPMFEILGPDAQGLLGVIAFFPQGIDENNLDWLFPTISNRANICDNFCILSLAYRSNGFITMLAPLRDYLCPKDPALSPLLCATKDHYFRRLLVDVGPGWPGFEEAKWITSEDVNVEHLLNVFTSIDVGSVDVWNVCACFMEHLYWHKRRLVGLGPKIEELPDDHPFKPQCLSKLSKLFQFGDYVEHKRLLSCALELWRERGDDLNVAHTLRHLSNANRVLGLDEEGIQQATEALETFGELNHTSGQGGAWEQLASLLYEDGQLDAAEEASLQAINLFSIEDNPLSICECYRILGNICRSKGKIEQAINHFRTALKIATTSGWQNKLFWIHLNMTNLFLGENRFDEAQVHIEHAKSHAINDTYLLARAIHLEAAYWYKQSRLKEAKSRVLDAINALEKLGATEDVKGCTVIHRSLGRQNNIFAVSH